MPFSKRSLRMLNGVHPTLVKIMTEAMQLRDATPSRCADFMILEGIRKYERQLQLKAEGATKTMNSRHLTGHAVDVIPLDNEGKASFAWPLYYPVVACIWEAASNVLFPGVQPTNDDLRVHLTWGGDWKTFKDGPHWELTWEKYPVLQQSLPLKEKK